MNRFVAFVFVFALCVANVSAFTSYSTPFSGSPDSYSSVVRSDFRDYYTSSHIQDYWPILNDPESCRASQNILIQVSPAGCQPTVVRSDLLGEQNVPVFCQLDALTLNPLLDVKSIDTISFSGSYPKEVVGAGFHPARAALRTYDRLLGDPIINNIGYVVVVLKKQPDERQLPGQVNLTLRARIRYNADNTFGVGRAEFLLEPQSDSEWASERNRQSFWQGRFFVRLEESDSNTASVAFYQGERRITSIKVKRGETSREFYLPGSYCQAGLSVSYDGFVPAETTALLQVDDDALQVTRGMQFLNGKCRVNSITQNFDTETAQVSCNGKSYDLVLTQRTLVQGDIVRFANEPNSTRWVVDRVNSTIVDGRKFTNYNITRLNDAGGAVENKIISSLVGVVPVSTTQLTDRVYNDQVESSVKKALEGYDSVLSQYGAERDTLFVNTTYGEAALKQAILLANNLGKQQTAESLIQQFLTDYPDSEDARYYYTQLSQLATQDITQSSLSVFVNGETHTIRLIKVNQPKEQSKASFLWGNSPTLREVIVRNTTVVPGLGNLTVDSISVDSRNGEVAQGSVVCQDTSGGINSSRFTLYTEGQGQVFCNQVLKLDNVDLGTQARIRVTPSVKNLESDTNVTVVVGIDKRDVKLTPDKTKDKIKALNETIKKWDSISNSLGNSIKGLKAACFATAGVLTVKNFLTGISGEGIARQKVMREHWNLECSRLVSLGTYSSLGECYYRKSADIERDVQATHRLLEAEDRRIKEIESGYSQPVEGIGNLFGEKIVDRNRSANDFVNLELLRPYGDSEVEYAPGQIKKVRDLVNSSGGYDRGEFTYDEVRDMRLNLDIINSPDASEGMKASARQQLGRLGRAINDNTELSARLNAAQSDSATGWPSLIGEPLAADSRPTRYLAVVPKESIQDPSFPSSNFGSSVTHTARVPIRAATRQVSDSQTVTFEPGAYVVGLRKVGDSYVPENVFRQNSDGSYTQQEDMSVFLDTYNLGAVKSYDQVSYNNRYYNPEIRYYETEPYKGMPAIVPFDTQRGWYAATKQTLPTFGGIGSFDASGRVNSLWICNVGQNGQEQFFEGTGDDICQQVNLNTGQPLDQFPGLEQEQARRLITRAVDAVQQAAQQYSSGKRVIQIRGLSGSETLPVGRPAANIPATQCQDYMSPDECRLLFNVCDPVICPSSRCDLGGAYPVADVIQTGIVGSALLCLPNFKEGIYVPVCLTGIKAGIDSYLSILKSHQQCLEENLESGKYVGICDEITAIYTCEFFWRQVAPAANVLLPKLVEVATGKIAPHGGGEYLTTQAAWQQAEGSVKYFTQTYAVNSLQAFKIRSVEEAGSTFCKAFISAKGPKSFEALVEPDSPPQFYAWFSTTPFTDATVPATTQYKVFYHIFAGNDLGSSYRVYLKDPPSTSFYQTTPTITVASGFVSKGQYATETKDFTAPEGYQQLCVLVNNKEECGFKQVSTSFALNQLRDGIARDELGREGITSEQTCISGGSNPLSLVQPNLQAGLQDVATPQAYDRGVVRICGTRNPGSETDPTRFVDVGYCGDSKIRCWLDKRSIDNSISSNNLGVKNATLTEVEQIQKNTLAERKIIYQDDEATSRLGEFVDQRESLKNSITLESAQALNAQIDVEFDKFFYNHQKARLLLLKAQIYDDLARVLATQVQPVAASTTSPQTTPPASVPAVREPWTLENALVKVGTLSGRYGSSAENKKFVDELCVDGLLTNEQCVEIKGGGFWNAEESMSYVRLQLLNAQKK